MTSHGGYSNLLAPWWCNGVSTQESNIAPTSNNLQLLHWWKEASGSANIHRSYRLYEVGMGVIPHWRCRVSAVLLLYLPDENCMWKRNAVNLLNERQRLPKHLSRLSCVCSIVCTSILEHHTVCFPLVSCSKRVLAEKKKKKDF